MKKRLKIGFGLLVILALILWIIFNMILRTNADWEFIQKVGGIKVETPLETEDGFYLPVICNVSGTDSITIKPTMHHSALSCIKIKPKVTDNTIHLVVVTGIGIFKRDICTCKAVNIGHLETGNYKVYYGDNTSISHQIGTFDIINNLRINH